MTDEAEKEAARLRALQRYDILDTPDEAAYDDLVRMAARICGAPIAGISLVDHDRLWFKSKYGVDATQMARQNSFCSYTVQGETTMVVPDASKDPRFAATEVVTGPAHFRFYAGACLRAPGGEKIGTLWVVDRQPRELNPEQRDALEALTRQTVAQLELRRTVSDLWGELDLARKIQTTLLPSTRRIMGYSVGASMQTASTVGGDYYDVFEAAERGWVLIGDVSGHGVPAGLVMMMVQSAVRAAAQSLNDTASPPSPARLLGTVNRALRSNLQLLGKDQYMTVTALCLDDATLRYAGLHQDLLIYRAASRSVERIETDGMWLGLVDELGPTVRDRTLELDPGDILLLFTDGLTEARNQETGELFGQGRLEKLFLERAQRGIGPQELVDQLLAEVEGYERADDRTLVALTRPQSSK